MPKKPKEPPARDTESVYVCVLTGRRYRLQPADLGREAYRRYTDGLPAPTVVQELDARRDGLELS